jgi:hypothetical protein
MKTAEQIIEPYVERVLHLMQGGGREREKKKEGRRN